MRTTAAVCAMLFMLSCGGDSPTEPLPPGERIRVVARPAQTDTVDAILRDTLVVEVRNRTGGAAAAIAVHIVGAAAPAPTPYVEMWETESGLWVFSTRATTDAQGRIRLPVRMGPVTGTAQMVISIPGDSTVGGDTISFSITAGNLHSIETSPADTAVVIGRTYTVVGRPLDRHRNPRTDAVTYRSADNTELTVTAAGVVTTLAMRRGAVIASFGNVEDTAKVSVVPAGRMALARTDRILLMDTDGSNRRELIIPNTSQLQNPSFHPLGDLILTRAEPSQYFRLIAMDTVTGAIRRVIAPTPGIGSETSPTLSSDGAYIYFVNDNTQGTYEMWRVRVDGTGAERITSQQFFSFPVSAASPSPAGDRAILPLGDGIRMLDLSTGVITAFRTGATHPRWAPVGNLIAFRAPTTLRLINADGTGERTLINADVSYFAAYAWAQDARWIIATDNGLVLIDTQTNEVLPLPFAQPFGPLAHNNGVALRTSN